jgi:hypothetical protein
MNDEMRIELSDDVGNLVGAVQGNATELRTMQTTTRRVGIDAENVTGPRLLFDHRRRE